MASRMMLFIGLTFYCIIGSLFLGYIGLTQGTPITDQTDVIEQPDYTGFILIDIILGVFNIITTMFEIVALSFIYAIELPMLVNVLLIFLPTTFWIIIGLSFITPTTNAGG